jgi:hypothetical protein
MNNRQRALAILNYQNYDRMPVVHFGFWDKTLIKWAKQGHITPEQAQGWGDGNQYDAEIGAKLGFDINWSHTWGLETRFSPPFETKILEELPDGTRKIVNADAVIVLQKDDATGIPTEIDHLFKGRDEWETHFLPRLKMNETRTNIPSQTMKWLQKGDWDYPLGVWCGSLYGFIRDFIGMVNLAYLQSDDQALFEEIVDTVGELCYECTRRNLETGAGFDFAHFWEDICFKSGPLVNPRVFRQRVGPHYRRITDLLHQHGIQIVSLDCDGKIDALVPIWLENGVNTMFPIEVGTWNASIAPWRAKYGKDLRGIGGMDKRVFAYDYAAIDAEIERLKPLVDLGGYIPCPDHRLAPDAKWENVQYYCERMRQTFH